MVHAFREDARGLLEGFGVEAHAAHLHVGQHRHKRHLYLLKQPLTAHLLEPWLQDVLQLQRHVGVFGSILVDILRVEVGHVLLSLSLGAYELLDVDGPVVEQLFGHVVHVVFQFGLDDVVGEHGVPHFAAHPHSIVAQHLKVVLDVLAHFERRGVLVERFENVNYSQRFFTFSRNGHVEGLVFLYREAQSHELGVYRIGGSGLRV